jgi:hypothetical protein
MEGTEETTKRTVSLDGKILTLPTVQFFMSKKTRRVLLLDCLTVLLAAVAFGALCIECKENILEEGVIAGIVIILGIIVCGIMKIITDVRNWVYTATSQCNDLILDIVQDTIAMCNQHPIEEKDVKDAFACQKSLGA